MDPKATLIAQLAVLAPPRRAIRFERLDSHLEEPAKQNPWGPEAQEELREIALGRCRCRPGHICPSCQEALAEN